MIIACLYDKENKQMKRERKREGGRERGRERKGYIYIDR
jgi:hypothetical protein